VIELRRLIADLKIQIVPVDAEQARMASVCYATHGKGIAAPGLNIGTA
jgi:uncharacterized protein with PIN domain